VGLALIALLRLGRSTDMAARNPRAPAVANRAQPQVQPVPAGAAPPDLTAPDYGPAIQRGGADVEFSLYDAHGASVPVGEYTAHLWRRVGSYWLQDDVVVDRDRNIVDCCGLGLDDTAPGGLEPGRYELELESSRWGNFRHEFHVKRGERRAETLTTPNWKRTIRLHFEDEAGQPIPYLPWRPWVNTTSTPLAVRERPAAPTVDLRSPPGSGSPIGVGGYVTRMGTG
jgi:hypothetical protein